MRTRSGCRVGSVASVADARIPSYKLVDLFSGAGGMSVGFAAHPDFEVVGAADLELGKPNDGAGACTATAATRPTSGCGRCRSTSRSSIRAICAGIWACVAASSTEAHAEVHPLSEVGLCEQRERSRVIAVAPGVRLHSLAELWGGHPVRREATCARNALDGLAPLRTGKTDPDDPNHTSTAMAGDSLARIAAMPEDGVLAGPAGDAVGALLDAVCL